MKLENLVNSIIIGATSGVLSAFIITQKEILSYPLFFLSVISAGCFCIGTFALFLCEDKRDRRAGLIILLFSFLIFDIGYVIELFLNFL